MSLKLPQIYDKYKNAFINIKYLNDIEKYSSEKHNIKATSKVEKEVTRYVKEIYHDEIIENDKTLIKNNNAKFLEIDIFLPKLNLGIEFNGVHWHSTFFKNMNYHKDKVEICRNKNIKLIHIYEDLWKLKKDYIKNIIKECIDGTFQNILYKDGKNLIGNNDYPIFGNYKIIEITKPEKHIIGKNIYYDSGKIKYRSLDK